MTLKLASKLELPNDAVTQTFLILGKRGSGKTNTATVLVEEMVKLAPVVILDPIDAWWGLKSSFDGGSEGLKVYVFGGPHGDLPLDPDGGELMARLFIEHRISMVLSMKGWSIAQRARFVTDFVSYLLNHNERVPVHVVLEEADAFIPQRPQAGEEKMLGATDRLIRWGRMDGIGATAITQRAAAINKNTTTQAETLIVHRVIGPQDRDAVLEWIKFHGSDEERRQVLTELPHLQNGEAYVWSPEWLHILDRVFIRRRRTFDSAATPKVGEKRIEPKTLSKVDLEKISGQLQAVIAHAKQDDPKELRKQLLEAQRQLQDADRQIQMMRGTVQERVVEKVVEVATLPEGFDEFVKLWNELSGTAHQLVEKGQRLVLESKPRIERVMEAPARAERPSASNGLGTGRKPDAVRSTPQPALRHLDLTAPQQRILDALAWVEMWSTWPTQHWTVIAMLSNQSPKSSGFANNVSVLRVAGLVDGNRGGGLKLTEQGQKAAAVPQAYLTNAELHNAIASKLTAPQARILRYLVRVNAPSLETWEKVAHASEQSPTSSGFANNVSVLRSMGLVRGNRGTGLEATEILFIPQDRR